MDQRVHDRRSSATKLDHLSGRIMTLRIRNILLLKSITCRTLKLSLNYEKFRLKCRRCRKILAHNICTMINLKYNFNILDIEPLVN